MGLDLKRFFFFLKNFFFFPPHHIPPNLLDDSLNLGMESKDGAAEAELMSVDEIK